MAAVAAATRSLAIIHNPLDDAAAEDSLILYIEAIRIVSNFYSSRAQCNIVLSCRHIVLQP